MTPFIPEEKILEIKEAASLEEVVGQYVKLLSRGRHLVGLCPFHPETTPSFTVSPERGIFHCFGCGVGGNIFSFLMHYHRLSFPEAVEELARRYSIPLSWKDMGPEAKRSRGKRQTWQQVQSLAATFYRNTLTGAAGRAGREYLAKRGMNQEIIDLFQLGYAPPDWDNLRHHLQKQGISLEAAQEMGLLVARPSGGYYDRFRDRVMFPILDRQARVIAFGGRIVGDGEPKYLNSPETPLYSKSRILYGLPQAQQSLRQQDLAILVEGYLDLLALRVHGIEPVLATLGTALTREQVRLLKGLVSRVVLVFDGDAAGVKAMWRAFPLFAEEGLAVRVLPLPAGMDPDTYAFRHGVDLFRDPWDQAQPWFAFVLEGLIGAHTLDIQGRVQIVERLRPFFQPIADPVEQGLWLKFTAERLAVEEASLRRSLTGATPLCVAKPGPENGLAINLEKKIIKWILHHPSAFSLQDLEEWTLDFEDSELQSILGLIIETYRQCGSLDHSLLIQQTGEERLQQQICTLTLSDLEVSSLSAELLADEYRRALLSRRLEKARQALKAKLAQAVVQGGEDYLDLLTQRQDLDRQLEALKAQVSGKGDGG